MTLVTDPALMTPEQRASFEMFGFAEYRPYWPNVKLKQRDGSMKSWDDLVQEYRNAQ